MPAASRRVLGWGCAAALWVALAGCQENLYRAGKLPQEFLATKAPNPRQIDFSRLGRSAAQTDVIYPGDVVCVTLETGVEERPDLASTGWNLRVSDTGEVNVPLIGAVAVVGLTLRDAEQAIRQASIVRQVHRDPQVAVLLTERKSIRVTVVGAVRKPGTYELPAANNDLLHTLVAAGGLKETASTIVEIRNPNTSAVIPASFTDAGRLKDQHGTARVDLITASQGLPPDYRIGDGSVIMVREQDPRTIQVIGLVRKPDQFEIEPDREIRLLDALALAQGRTMEIADKVHVIRQLDSMQQPIVISASVRAAKRGGPDNLLLTAGDVVSVEETPLTFVIGTITGLVRFGVSAAIPGL